ncbi:hypothetical protein WA1_35035 [Scytonema hofmannii PCC 7110]|uniref:Uncharacterized protein n=1 Tax=Scytonema hofmannii PCC 7110 TaxID=128403 RepID=A0A139X297_9CYAN|nr:hypothetical protein WA1_35035 [Scytonema hofmannii PCC 7110]
MDKLTQIAQIPDFSLEVGDLAASQVDNKNFSTPHSPLPTPHQIERGLFFFIEKNTIRKSNMVYRISTFNSI